MNTIENVTFDSNDATKTLEEIIRGARACRRARPVRYDSLDKLQVALRNQRRRLLGSLVPFSSFLYTSDYGMHAGVFDLIEYLSERTLALWNKPKGEHLRFCQQFYELAFSCENKDVTLDDVILFASTLVHDEKRTFIYFMEEVLPEQFFDMLHSFTYDFPDKFYEAAFEDAVLGAVCILLGAMKDILEEEDV